MNLQIQSMVYLRAEDMPTKAWVLDGPPPGMDMKTWRNVGILNQILRARLAEQKKDYELTNHEWQDRMALQAARRLPPF